MSTKTNQAIFDSLIDAFRLIDADGRLTLGDALIVVELLMCIDWRSGGVIGSNEVEVRSE